MSVLAWWHRGLTLLILLPLLGIPAPEATAQSDPIITIAGGGNVEEGAPARFTLTANTAPAADLKVKVRVLEPVSGMFVDPDNKGDRIVTIAAGASTTTFMVPTVDDNVDEEINNIIAIIQRGEGYDLPPTENPSASVANVLVEDNDLPMVSFGAATYDVDEGDAVTLTLNMVGPQSTATTVTVACTAVTTGATEFSGCPSAVTIPANASSHSFTVQTTEDTIDEVAETFTVQIIGVPMGFAIGWPSSATVTVADDDDVSPPGTPVVTISGGSGVTEGGAVTFTLTATPAPTSTITVDVVVTQSGSFATSGQTGTQTVSVGTNGQGTLTVGTDDDSTDEADGTITVTIQDGADYDVGSTATATVAVADDDVSPPGTPVVTISGGSGITEGGNTTFTLTATPVRL